MHTKSPTAACASSRVLLHSLQILRAKEFYTGRPTGRMFKFDVLVTTYEMVIKDSAVLRPIR